MRVTAVLVASSLVGACSSPGAETGRSGIGVDEPDTVEVTSSAFEEGARIPTRFTCDGEDVPPPLSWSNVPDGAEEIVIVVDDPDAPGGTFIHWIVAGIDPTTERLDAGEVPEGAVEGTNDFGEARYRGPCPPAGDDPHRYEFVVFAMEEATRLGEQPGVEEFREVIEGHAIATGTLTAEYGGAG